MVLRPAIITDAPAIARIWREGWPDGHEGHVPDALAAERTAASFDQRATPPFTYQAQTATGTVPVPAHRYERDVGDG